MNKVHENVKDHVHLIIHAHDDEFEPDHELEHEQNICKVCDQVHVHAHLHVHEDKYDHNHNHVHEPAQSM